MSEQTISQPVTKESMIRSRNIYLAMIQIIDESIIPSQHENNSKAIKDHCILLIKNVDATIDKISELEEQLKASKAKNDKKPANKSKRVPAKKAKKKTTKKKVAKKNSVKKKNLKSKPAKKAVKKKTAKKKTKLRAVK